MEVIITGRQGYNQDARVLTMMRMKMSTNIVRMYQDTVDQSKTG